MYIIILLALAFFGKVRSTKTGRIKFNNLFNTKQNDGCQSVRLKLKISVTDNQIEH